MSLTAYWLANFTMDYSKYMIFAISGPLIITLFEVEIYYKDGSAQYLWILFFTYGFTIIMFSYVMSFKFKEAGTAQIMMFLYSFVGGFILMLICFILTVIPKTRTIGENLPKLFRIFVPPFNLSNALLKMSLRTTISYHYLKSEELLSPWDSRVGGTEYWWMVVQGIVCFVILIVLENI